MQINLKRNYYIRARVVAITAMAADSFPPRERGQAMSLYTVSNGVGQKIGPLFAGLFIDAADFNTYFIFCGVFVGLSAVIILFFVKETLPVKGRKVVPTN